MWERCVHQDTIDVGVVDVIGATKIKWDILCMHVGLV